jgi:glycine/D-amino acid oxidase-like deaminating enzyme
VDRDNGAFPHGTIVTFSLANEPPTGSEGEISQEKLAAAREYLRLRFPAMADAPLLESRVCQYENSTDHNFVLDRHPEAENVSIIGGGSSHGFEHGPVMGERVAPAL